MNLIALTTIMNHTLETMNLGWGTKVSFGVASYNIDKTSLTHFFIFDYHYLNQLLQESEATVTQNEVIPTHVPSSLEELHALLSPLGLSWSNQTSSIRPIEQVKFCKISSQPSTSAQPLVVTHSVIVNADFSWQAFVHGHVIRPMSSNPLSSIPTNLDRSHWLNLCQF